MKTTASFTSTISPELIAWVDKRARTQKRTRRAVLEEALKNYQREAMRNVLKDGFARASRDADMLELAEWGMDDYREIVGRTHLCGKAKYGLPTLIRRRDLNSPVKDLS